MTTLLLRWINDELALHRKVDVLERDLCNGYILAEILHAHGLENHLERYSDDNELSTRVRNLELLGKAMAVGGMGELSTNTKRAIMMENRSAILQLLLQVKEFVESRGKKLSSEQLKLKSVASRVYEQRSPVKHASQVIQDIEDRFVKETAQQYRPKKVKFYKDINSAVHLRKFPQTQWQRENEQIEHETRMAADQVHQSSANMAALPSHLKEKHDFMQEWDHERLQKWQDTQKLYMEAERNDLRLELTLEEKKRRHHAFKLAQIQLDAMEGVVSFENNMNRLGLGGSSTGGAAELPLRAVASTDPGPIAHLDRQEQRVKEIGFRPSNNIQMMKELRARRKAQLAAEKDRRMRRMKTASDSNNTKTVEVVVETAASVEDEAPIVDSSSEDEESPATPNGTVLFDTFIASKRDALEANYAHLREVGARKREIDTEELLRLRLEKRSRALEQSTFVCAELVDGLIGLAIAQSEHRDVCDAQEATAACAPLNASEVQISESDDELTELTDTFINMSNVWGSLGPRGSTSSTNPSLSSRVASFVERALAAISGDALSTTWTPLSSFKLLAVFTSDDRGHTAARQVAVDHSLYYVNVEELINECLKHSYDPVKQTDHAASLGIRERELGLFGPKLTLLRQKNTAVPDALVVDIVVAAIALTKAKDIVDEQIQEEPVVAADAPRVPPLVGCLLHNFPRNLEEWKLFEKAMTSATSQGEPDDDATAARLAALDASIGVDSSDEDTFTSCIDAGVVVSYWPTPEERPASPLDGTLSASPSTTELTPSTEQRRSSANSAQQADAAKRQAAAEQLIIEEEEARRKRQQVESVLARTSRVVSIAQTEMNERVLQEIMHLSIDIYTSEAPRERLGEAVQCSSDGCLPSDLQTAREERRSTMTADTRIAWLVASKELVVDERSLLDGVTRLRELEARLPRNLEQLFRVAQGVLVDVTQSTRSTQQELDDLLSKVGSACAAVLETHGKTQRSNSKRVDKALTATEVSLGDIVDHHRVLANGFVDRKDAELLPSRLMMVVPWLRFLPLVCLELKEYALDTMGMVTNDFFKCFPFLKSKRSHRFPLSGLSDLLDDVESAANGLDQTCVATGLSMSFKDEVSRLAGQLATRRDSSEFGEQDLSGSESRYELMEHDVAAEITRTALSQMAAVLRWSNALVDRVKTVSVTDVSTMRDYISRDVKLNNDTIASVMQRLSQTESALWPLAAASGTALRQTRHQQEAVLSITQVEIVVAELRAIEHTGASKTSQSAFSLSCELFVATVIATARKHEFPDPWQEAESVARLARAWAGSRQERVPWRQVLFALVCTQFIDFPIVDGIESAANQFHQLMDSTSRNTLAGTITREEFHSRVRLWFEREDPPTVFAPHKALLFSLFATDASPGSVQVLPMLLTWCAATRFPRDVRVDLATALLPRFSRGLRRAFSLLTHWLTLANSGPPQITMNEFSLLLRFAEVEVDDNRMRSLLSHPLGRFDANEFLILCDAYDPAIAERFDERDSFAALVN